MVPWNQTTLNAQNFSFLNKNNLNRMKFRTLQSEVHNLTRNRLENRREIEGSMGLWNSHFKLAVGVAEKFVKYGVLILSTLLYNFDCW